MDLADEVSRYRRNFSANIREREMEVEEMTLVHNNNVVELEDWRLPGKVSVLGVEVRKGPSRRLPDWLRLRDPCARDREHFRLHHYHWACFDDVTAIQTLLCRPRFRFFGVVDRYKPAEMN